MIYRFRILSIALMLLLIGITGCGGNVFEGLTDDSSDTAKKEAARIALDKGNYADAVNILEGLCGTTISSMTCDDETKADLASAYLAMATSLDVLKLIDAADSSSSGSFNTISTLLPITQINDCASTPSSCPMKTYLDKSIDVLDSLLPDTVPASPTSVQKNQYLQLATASAVDIIVSVGTVSSGLNSNTGLPNSTPSSVATDVLTAVSRDIGNIALGLEGANILDTGISQDVNEIRNSISADDVVTEAEFISYISSL